MPTTTFPELVDVDTAAAMLAVDKRFIYRQVQAGRIPHVKLGPRVLRFAVADLEAFIATGRREAAAR